MQLNTMIVKLSQNKNQLKNSLKKEMKMNEEKDIIEGEESKNHLVVVKMKNNNMVSN